MSTVVKVVQNGKQRADFNVESDEPCWSLEVPNRGLFVNRGLQRTTLVASIERATKFENYEKMIAWAREEMSWEVIE